MPRARLTVVTFALASLPLSAQVTFHHDKGKELLAADARIERVATGLQFTEGPIWLAAEKVLVFSDIPANVWLRWDPAAKEAERLIRWKPSAAANGNTLDLDGSLLSCQHEARNVVRHRVDGTTEVVVSAHDGKPLNSPNDLVVRSDGTLWFTDPTYGLGKREKAQAGNFVYRFDPKTKEVKCVQHDFDMPNGLCFSPDQSRLYVADSGTKQRVGAFPVVGDGLGEAAFWLEGGADGMRCDAAGNLWTTARDGVRVYGADGVHLATVKLPEQPSNCAFGGEDLRTLFVTARTSVFSFAVKSEGAPVPPAKSSVR
ncbi:MAG: SMP-30/gluconolactonase/LRE family protein [Planctomycetes bacterium]|nr:SMP-30/gluconolactonase/LRE family protein [Planctomycetota bacterium]